MVNDVITPENLSREALASVFDQAFMDYSYDGSGDLMVNERVRCWVLPKSQEPKDRITLMTLFRCKPNTSQLQRLEVANRINNGFAIIKTSVEDDGTLRFSYDFVIGGGISKKAFVLGVKRFCSVPHDAVSTFGADVVQ